jgi:hypothetical protein
MAQKHSYMSLLVKSRLQFDGNAKLSGHSQQKLTVYKICASRLIKYNIITTVLPPHAYNQWSKQQQYQLTSAHKTHQTRTYNLYHLPSMRLSQ